MTCTWQRSIPLLTSFCMAAMACGSNDLPENVPDTEPPPLARATWHQDVAPIVFEKCVGCHHTDGGIAPFGLETYDEAAPLAAYMLEKVQAGEMPPWSARANDECSPEHDWKNDARLSAAQMAVLQTWVEDGAAQGDPATAAPLPARPSYELQGVTHDLAMTPYVTSGFDDELVCFVLDPELTSLQYMTGVEMEPSNLEVAHHATLTVVPPAGAADVRDRVGPDGSFRCTGGVAIQGAYSLGVWVPGAVPFETPATSGTPMAPGSVIVLQMHYHPTGFAHEPDQTRVKLRMTSEKPEKTFLFTALGNAGAAPNLLPGENDDGEPRFFIPANVAAHRETMEFTIDAPGLAGKQVPIVAVTPHMHYVGQDMQVNLRHANPVGAQSSDECLVNVIDWDFDWQRTYNYDAEIDDLPTITDGDTITLKCDYNNTMSNPFVQRMLSEEGLENPINILLGEETTDEMCIAIVGLLF